MLGFVYVNEDKIVVDDEKNEEGGGGDKYEYFLRNEFDFDKE